MIVTARRNCKVPFAVAIEVGSRKNGDGLLIGNRVGENPALRERSVAIAGLKLDVIAGQHQQVLVSRLAKIAEAKIPEVPSVLRRDRRNFVGGEMAAAIV